MRRVGSALVAAMPLALLALLAGCTQATGDGGKALPDAPIAGQLRGVVIDAAVRPIEGVAVAIPGRPEVPASLTDASGLFAFADLAPGTVVLAASKPGYLDAFVQVAVEEVNPVVQIELAPLAETTPFYVLEAFEGFMDCGLGSGPAFGLTAGCMVIVGGTLYVACAGSDPVPPTGVCIGDASPYYISTAQGNMTNAQTEAVWSPTVQGQSELLIGSYVVDGQGTIVGGLPSAAGQSILVRRINATIVDDYDLGGANRAAIFVNPGNSGPANVVVQQSYQVFHSSAFYFELAEEWVFAVDGPPTVPDQCTTCTWRG